MLRCEQKLRLRKLAQIVLLWFAVAAVAQVADYRELLREPTPHDSYERRSAPFERLALFVGARFFIVLFAVFVSPIHKRLI